MRERAWVLLLFFGSLYKCIARTFIIYRMSCLPEHVHGLVWHLQLCCDICSLHAYSERNVCMSYVDQNVYYFLLICKLLQVSVQNIFNESMCIYTSPLHVYIRFELVTALLPWLSQLMTRSIYPSLWRSRLWRLSGRFLCASRRLIGRTHGANGRYQRGCAWA